MVKVMEKAILDMLGDPPAGYELRTVNLDRDTALRYYQAVTAVSANGVPDAAREEGAEEDFRAAHQEMLALIASLGGDINKPYRARYTDGVLDYFTYVGETKEEGHEGT